MGTAYGQEIAFTTVDEILPSVTGNITYNQYTCVHIAGSVDYEGSSPVLEKGVCWSTSPNPTIADNYMNFGAGTGTYNCSITNLVPETTYYFSVYARNNAGITCGPVNGGGYNGSVTTGYYPTPYFDNISDPTVIDESTMQISFDVTWYPTTYCRDSIVEKGFCWTTSNSHYDQSPSLSDNYISLGAGEGSVAYTMTGLTPNVYYHFRPYAITTAGVTFYGSTFIKKIIIYTPQVSTASVSDITDMSAVCGGNVTGTGTNQFDAAVTSRGVCWSTSPNPTIADSHTVDSSGTGVFTSTMTGLSPNTQYYVRAYATNGVGTGYGNEVSFSTLGWTCGISQVSDFDGNDYSTIQIGNQCWMKSNLRSTHNKYGTEILAYNYFTIPDSIYDISTHGYLYRQAAVDFLCPYGWHLPSSSDWNQLCSNVIQAGGYACDYNASTISKALASTEGWAISTNNCAPGNNPNTNNATGFSAFPVGYKPGSGTCSGFGYYCTYWSSTSFDANSVYTFRLSFNSSTVSVSPSSINYSGISYAYPIRCLRD